MKIAEKQIAPRSFVREKAMVLVTGLAATPSTDRLSGA
jgi:hypothetical protein